MSEEFKIEKNVPMPGRGSGRPQIWPWMKMEVDDSVFFPAKKGETGTTICRRVNPYSYAGRERMGKGKKFAMRWMEHEGKLGVRVWRTK